MSDKVAWGLQNYHANNNNNNNKLYSPLSGVDLYESFYAIMLSQ